MPTEDEIRAARAEFDRMKQEALNNLKNVEKERASFEATIDPSLELLMQERDGAAASEKAAAEALAAIETQLTEQSGSFQSERANLLSQLDAADSDKAAAEERTLEVEAELTQARATIRELRDQLSGL